MGPIFSGALHDWTLWTPLGSTLNILSASSDRVNDAIVPVAPYYPHHIHENNIGHLIDFDASWTCDK